MNIVKILLVIGLGYVAMTQKSEKTRNMLLVVTGLLAFCMFSMEGFTITSGTDFSTIFSGSTGTLALASGNTIEVMGSDRYTFSGTDDIDLNGTAPVPTTVTCKTGTSGDTEGTVGYKSSQTVWGTPPSAASIDDYLTCTTATTSTPCPSPAPDPDQCGDDKIYKSDITGLTFTGDQGGDNYKSSCCEDGCSDDDCSVFHSGENTKCGDLDLIFIKFDKNCK